MAYDPDAHRSTGRTTRLLDKAIAYAKLGRYVIVYAVHKDNVQWMYNFLLERSHVEQMEPVGDGKVYVGGGSISFVYRDDLFKRDRRRPHPAVVELIDPSYIERHFREQLEVLHQFDLPAGEVLNDGWKWVEIEPEQVLSSEEINSCLKGVTGSDG